ncbi:hypothetical protein [Alkalicoccobacillus porphyridii]|uniref:DUF3221 domain-containing protein n=1 Tax=Alkalicoccobacillus porphyridii TaxID=2597270 RepID=A0A554A1B6_9BACI|nr:hypothetical protein [Alkalicoccobacillus porphyridii]TSB47483.1 hypothetical protein FN960_07035 [Alkalicoccobacillus porphyridii]
MVKKLILSISIFILMACSEFDTSTSAIVEVIDKVENHGEYMIEIKDMGDAFFMLELDENVYNLIEVETEYFMVYKSNSETNKGVLERIEPFNQD